MLGQVTVLSNIKSLVCKGLVFKFVNLNPDFDVILEYIESRESGSPLTNPLESIFNSLGNTEVLMEIASELKLPRSEDILEILFDEIMEVYDAHVQSDQIYSIA